MWQLEYHKLLGQSIVSPGTYAHVADDLHRRCPFVGLQRRWAGQRGMIESEDKDKRA